MDPSKYVIGRDETGSDHVILMPFWQTHSNGYTGYALGTAGPCNLIAAGFFRLHANIYGSIDISCWGESISLGVKSRDGEQDEKLISQFLGIET